LGKGGGTFVPTRGGGSDETNVIYREEAGVTNHGELRNQWW